MNAVTVLPYNLEWKKEFNQLKLALEHILLHEDIQIEHVGSTSVVGLAAKPVIDLDIIIPSTESLPTIIQKLERAGYVHRGDLGIKHREAFLRRDNAVPYFNNTLYQFSHNLYVCIQGTTSLNNHLLFRNYLRDHEDVKEKYALLKQTLAKKYPHDIDAYCTAKTDFIVDILSHAGFNSTDLSDITSQNKS